MNVLPSSVVEAVISSKGAVPLVADTFELLAVVVDERVKTQISVT